MRIGIIYREHVKGAYYISIATVTGAILSFITQWILARYFGPNIYGSFSVAWATAQLFLPFCALGIPHFLIQRFKREGVHGDRWLKLAYVASAVLTSLVSVTFLIWLLFGGISAESRDVAGWFLLWMVATVPVIVVYGRYQLEHHLGMMALWPIMQIIPRTCVAIIVVLIGLGPTHVAAGFFIAMLPLTVYSISKLKQTLEPGYVRSIALPQITQIPSGNKASIATVVKYAWPFGISDILDKADLKLIVPLVALTQGDMEAGLMAVAAGFILVIYLLPSALIQRYFLPFLHEWSAHRPNVMRAFIRATLTIMIFVGIVSIPFFYMFGKDLIILIFGTDYTDAATAFALLTWGLPVLLAAPALNHVFLSLRAIRRLVGWQLMSVVMMIILVSFLGSIYGLEGAAIGLVSARAVSFLFIMGDAYGILGKPEK